MISIKSRFLKFDKKSTFVGYEKLECYANVIGSFDNAIVLDETLDSRIVGIKSGQIIDLPIEEAVEMKHEHTHGLRDLIDMLQ